MTDTEYLEAVLRSQTLAPGGKELAELQLQRKTVERIIGEKLGHANPTVRLGGSWAKKTMILEAYDLDLPTYFPHDETGAGESLEDIYNTVANALADDYSVERRRSALRLRRKEADHYYEDTHIDLVPARYFDASRTDAWIYQNQAEKCRLKTNLDIHIEHIRDSGLRQVDRLGKLWNVREKVGMKTFVLELLFVDLLRQRKTALLPKQFWYVLEQFRDNANSLSVTDPANANNDLTPALNAVKARLVWAAGDTLRRIDQEGWQSVFGPVDEEDRAAAASRLASAVPATARHQPWSSGQ